ncbi:MAG: 16S rRNA (uracil(1498)-N(3))-methyltransferase, partial [Victivallales bacterium]|nr:16S rRNA (uracil(1498)-N(3))-methyltransferase [Victivallales bacterium]
QTVSLLDGNGVTADAEILSVSKRGDEVVCGVSELVRHERHPVQVRLYLAPPRAKVMDLAVRFATELGVSRITPVLCRYGVSKPDGEKDGWRQTAIVACKQSRNPWLPILDSPISFAEALAASSEFPVVGMVPRGGREAEPPEAERSFGLWIGPEGGFAPEEEDELLANGAFPMTVGPCILRVETAVPALLGAVYSIIRN